MTKRAFGELELAILNIMRSGKRMTVKDVHKILGDENKYNTVMTVMSRLADKKILAREKIGLHYEYWILPASPKAPSFIQQFKQKLFGGKTSELVSYLIEIDDEISDQDLAEMEDMIQKAKEKRKKK